MVPQLARKLPLAAVIGVIFALGFAPQAMAKGPSATTESPTEIYAKGATLNGTIDTHGEATIYGFYYGTCKPLTFACISQTETQSIPAGESKPIHVSAKVTGLTPGSTYRVILVAANSQLEGTEGGELEFKPRGLYMTGEKSEEEAKQPKIASTGSYYTFAEIEGGGTFNVLGNNKYSGSIFRCKSKYVEVGFFGGPFSAFTIKPQFTECVNGESAPATVNFNGCSYQYTVANAGPPYSGSVALSCPAGKEVELTSSLGCKLRMPAQSFGGTVGFSEVPRSGYSVGGLRAATSASNVTYTLDSTGVMCKLYYSGELQSEGNWLLGVPS